MSNQPIQFQCGVKAKNKFMLAPLTNTQSHEDGCLSDEELNFLEMRAKGQFGIVMTCAAHVQEIGKGFPGQLGIFGDQHIEGLQRLTKAIHNHGSLALVQLHHAGMRSPESVIGQQPVSSSNNAKTNSRGLSLSEVHQLRDDFIAAAVRAKKSGFDGVEIHGAHGYILTQFISAEINQRTDEYGGSLENRTRIVFEIVDGVRNQCGETFIVGVRLSPERFGMDLKEAKMICQQLVATDKIDFLDISLWDCFKLPEDEKYQDKTLIQHFTELDYKKVKLTVAGKIRSGHNVADVLKTGVDFVTIGHSAILHHDFPVQVMDDIEFTSEPIPVSIPYLNQQGLSANFVAYMKKREGWVKE